MIVYDAELAHNDTPLSMTAVIGIYDDPDRQRQGRTVIEIGNKNTIIIGASQFGKTNLLELLVSSGSKLIHIISRGGIYRYTSDSGTHRQLYCIKRTVSAG